MKEHHGFVLAQAPLTDVRTKLQEVAGKEKEHTVFVAQHEHIKTRCGRARPC